jgi:hypothetical protein
VKRELFGTFGTFSTPGGWGAMAVVDDCCPPRTPNVPRRTFMKYRLLSGTTPTAPLCHFVNANAIAEPELAGRLCREAHNTRRKSLSQAVSKAMECSAAARAATNAVPSAQTQYSTGEAASERRQHNLSRPQDGCPNVRTRLS